MQHRDDDYSDLVEAGLAILCAALLLVAFFLFLLPKAERADGYPRLEWPSGNELVAPSISSNPHNFKA